MTDKLVRQGVHFDMDTKALEKYYPKEDWRRAYDDVRKYLEQNGFIHEQGSGYHSAQPMLQPKAIKIIRGMIKELPYLNKCVKICTVADVPVSFDISHMFNKKASLPIRPQNKP